MGTSDQIMQGAKLMVNRFQRSNQLRFSPNWPWSGLLIWWWPILWCLDYRSLLDLPQAAWKRLRCISKRADSQILETSPVRCINDVSTETSLRSLRDSQRRLWNASENVICYFQTEAFLGYLLIYLRIFKYFVNLI